MDKKVYALIDSYAEEFAAQLARWPAAEAQDLVKALYQAEFGCGHLLSNPEQARRWLAEELSGAALPESGVCPPLAESLGHFSRVHLLPARQLGLSADTLYALFALTAGETTGCMEDFQQQLPALEALANSGRDLTRVLSSLITFPFPQDGINNFLRGDYANLYIHADMTMPRLAETLLLGTEFGNRMAGLEGYVGLAPGSMVSPDPFSLEVEQGDPDAANPFAALGAAGEGAPGDGPAGGAGGNDDDDNAGDSATDREGAANTTEEAPR